MLNVINYDEKSSTILNAIRNEASAFYKERVPEANAENLGMVQTAIYDYESTRNEYASAIIDKIAFSEIDNMSFTNKLSVLKSASYQYGKDIEELWVDLVKDIGYNVADSAETLFKRYKPEILSCFHTLNRTSVYPITIEEEILTRAFTSETGYGDMMASLVATMQTSDEIDEFLYFKNLINANIIEGKVRTVTVAPVVDKATAENLVIEILNESNLYEFPKTIFNYANIVNSCKKESQVLLINTRVKGRLNVQVLATAFNMSKADFETMEITLDDFGSDSEKVVAMLCDKKWFKVRDRLRTFRNVINGKGLYTNRFYHVHQSISSSPFYNATVFIEASPTLTSIDLKPSTVSLSAGESRSFTVEAVGTNNPSSKCVYSVDGNSDSTFITKTGLLVLGDDEDKSTITVTAKSTFDETITDTATITLI